MAIIVVGHGKFGSGLQQAMLQIIGEQPEIAFVDFTSDKDPQSLTDEIQTALSTMETTKGVLCCCDILGGTPFRTAALLAQQLDVPTEVIAGTNLQMVIECAMEQAELDFADLVSLAKASGVRGITTVSEQFVQKKTKESNDGI